jgi:hypothetical protein
MPTRWDLIKAIDPSLILRPSLQSHFPNTPHSIHIPGSAKSPVPTAWSYLGDHTMILSTQWTPCLDKGLKDGEHFPATWWLNMLVVKKVEGEGWRTCVLRWDGGVVQSVSCRRWLAAPPALISKLRNVHRRICSVSAFEDVCWAGKHVRFNAVCLNVRYFCGEGGRRVSMSRSLSQEFSEPTAGERNAGGLRWLSASYYICLWMRRVGFVVFELMDLRSASQVRVLAEMQASHIHLRSFLYVYIDLRYS